MLFHKGGVCDTYEIQVVSGNSIVLSYIGQYDLHITCLGLLQVWYTLGVACVGYVT